MKHIIEMREKRAQLVNQARELHQRSIDEKRDMSADENTQYDKIMGEVDSLKAKIDREERLLAEQSEMESRTDRQTDGGTPEQRGGQKDDKQLQELAFRAWMAGGIDNLAPEQRSLMMEKRAQSTQTGSAGGYTVPEGFYAQLMEAMKSFGGVRAVARTMPTASGNNLLFPTANNTAQKGRILGENQQIQETGVTFDQKNIGAYKYTSDLILVPIELIQDSAFDIEAYVRQQIALRIHRITNEHFTLGTGVDQPNGIVTASVEGKVGASATAIAVDELIDIEHSIDPIYRNSAKWMFHDTTLKALKKLKDADGRFLWQAGLTVGAADSILGYGYNINMDMDSMAAGKKSVLFGDLGSYLIRDVMDISLVRFGEKYMDFGQIGFTAFSRHDADFINAGGNQIVHFANAAV